MKRKLLYVVGGCVVSYLIFHFFFTSNKKPAFIANVSVSPVVQQNVEVNLQTIGTVQAYSSIGVKSMVTGTLLSTGFKEGEVVAESQTLFQVDQREFIASLNQAKATLARDQAILMNNELQVKRNTPLLKKGFISKQDYDTLIANAKSAAATVQADEAAVQNAALQLEYTTIRAPIPGTTGNVSLKPGSLIKANDSDALVTINQINPIYVSFSLPQNKLTTVQKNLQRGLVNVKAILNTGDIEKGNLTFIDNSVDTTTGTIQLKATFANKLQRLWPGQYVTVDFPVEYIERAILIPSLALLAGQKGFYVYTIDDHSVAHMRIVTPGAVVNNQTVI